MGQAGLCPQLATIDLDLSLDSSGVVVSLSNIMQVGESLLQLDPIRSYAERGAAQVAKSVRADAYRFQPSEGDAIGSEVVPDDEPTVKLPLRVGRGRAPLGEVRLWVDGRKRLDDDEMRVARWAARNFARGLSYTSRLADVGARRATTNGETVTERLERTPLTKRERDVVVLLVEGQGTNDIASEMGLTVSTVNTYLKRIFAKLGVHSRVELVARLAGTAA